MKRALTFSLFFLFISKPIHSEVTLYTAGVNDGNVYSLDAQSGNLTKITPTPVTPSGLNGIAVLNSSNAYVAGNDGNFYQVNLQTGVAQQIAIISPGNAAGLNGVALVGSNTAYVAGFNSGDFYEVNLLNGNIQTLHSTPSLAAAAPSCIRILNSARGFAPGFYSGNAYEINLTNAQNTSLVSVPGSSPADMALLNASTAYTVGYSGVNNVYQINLQEGTFEQVVHIVGTPSSALSGIALLNDQTAYVVSAGDDYVFVVDIPGQTYSTLYNGSLSGAGFTYASLLVTSPPPPSPIIKLTGNNLQLANYLNTYASPATKALFYGQNNLASALESAAPTRNACSTFITQTTQAALSQTLSDHLHRDLFPSELFDEISEESTQFLLDSAELLADAKEKLPSKKHRTTVAWSPWISMLGEYLKEKAQLQTPSFTAGVGGLIAGFDYISDQSCYLTGAGVAYARSHVHEDNGFGCADINQGYLLFYGSFPKMNWYFDTSLWGGYYHISNERNIVFNGFIGEAKSTFHGWQLTPHLEFGYDQFHLLQNDLAVFTVNPFASGDWINNWESNLKEHGTDGLLDFGQSGRWCFFLRCEGGLRLQERVQTSWGSVIFLEKMSYVYQKAFGTGTIHAFLVGSPGNFTVTTLSGAQNLGIGEFEILFAPKNNKYPYGSFSYQGEFGSRYQAHEFNFNLGFHF